MALELKNIYKVYPNGYQAISDFNLKIEDKEFIVLVGPSGCGKSTTLRMIAGLEEITHGDFLINGVKVNKLSPKDRGIAMVFQSYALYPTLTVYENMAFALDLAGFDEDIIEKKVKNTAKILGLTPYLDRLPRALSGGQRQRVALGRAIIRNAKIFLMDEPLSNLDARQRVSMRSELLRIHREVGSTTIYVTHDQIEAMTMASRIVCMDVGVIKQVGTPEELYFHPKNLFVAGFIGDPPMNFIKGKVEDNKFVSYDSYYHFTLDVFNEKQLSQLEGKDITIGYRPEAAFIDDSLKDNNDYIKLDGSIEVYEMLGDLQNVYLNVGEEKTIIKAKPEVKLEIGEKLEYYVKKKDFHFFLSESTNVVEFDENDNLIDEIKEEKPVEVSAETSIHSNEEKIEDNSLKETEKKDEASNVETSNSEETSSTLSKKELKKLQKEEKKAKKLEAKKLKEEKKNKEKTEEDSSTSISEENKDEEIEDLNKLDK